ncbi:unnamed protein product [Aphanomyces euteiches]|uniref:Secreted protein n=1 Tax=Aphanomyces euteiches TaxID=100861 RepID=A0A6G0XTR1_9STRA|nr:hypothetical protein Ae201684_001552 [Aphanomyces euteiches]KAH9075264.1 hypothetical protein Ae201684P_003946 [Aphanomyces euteiches]KAH9148008.1 hypothetical protein AeRB84_008484 [Aphanomyces euteiches]
MKVTTIAATSFAVVAAVDNVFNPVPATLPKCQNPAPKTCGFYFECLDVAHPCRSTGYAQSFGGKYCELFDNKMDWFSLKGQAWMFGTMTCLQRKLVTLLNNPSLSCANIHSFAFDSHPSCYTTDNANGISVCDLPVTDWFSLLRVIGLKTLIQLDTIENGNETGLKCLREYFHWETTSLNNHTFN